MLQQIASELASHLSDRRHGGWRLLTCLRKKPCGLFAAAISCHAGLVTEVLDLDVGFL